MAKNTTKTNMGKSDVIRYRKRRRSNLMALCPDLLLQILKSVCVDLLESPSSITQFADAWNRAWFVRPFWHTLDLSMFKSDWIKATVAPYIHVNSKSEWILTSVLILLLDLSRKRIRTLIFHYNLFLSDEQFVYTAERCPNLRRLVLPAWNKIKKAGMCRAIRGCRHLESLTMPSIADPPYLLRQISRHCKKFSELKIMGPCDMHFAQSLAQFVPNLRVLSLRCSTLDKKVLIFILTNLRYLEVLNISHCILMETLPPPQHTRIIREIDRSIRQRASRLREFFTCMDDSCIMCQRTRTDEGLVRWYRYEEGLWKTDEVESLAL